MPQVFITIESSLLSKSADAARTTNAIETEGLTDIQAVATCLSIYLTDITAKRARALTPTSAKDTAESELVKANAEYMAANNQLLTERDAAELAIRDEFAALP